VRISQTKIELIRNDITKIHAEAIVNAANRTLLGGGGVDGAIHRAAGLELIGECATLGGCETGQAKITQGYKLPAKFVIHTVGPVWSGGKHNEEKLLADCYYNSLHLALEHQLKTIAFPSISTGAYRFPIESASQIALKTIQICLKKNPCFFEKIIIVLFSENDLHIYERVFREVFGAEGYSQGA